MVQRSPKAGGCDRISRPEAVKAKKAGLCDTLYEARRSRSVVVKRDGWSVASWFHCNEEEGGGWYRTAILRHGSELDGVTAEGKGGRE